MVTTKLQGLIKEHSATHGVRPTTIHLTPKDENDLSADPAFVNLEAGGKSSLVDGVLAVLEAKGNQLWGLTIRWEAEKTRVSEDDPT